MTLDDVAQAASRLRLEVLGGFSPGPEDHLPPETKTLLLLGPAEPGFWPHVRTEPEFADGRADPLDRWSQRVVTRMAHDLGATAYFPFGGPPFQPFIAWAQRSGRAWSSEVGILVHDTQGLMVSYRGALGFREQMYLPSTGPRPCDDCAEKPCLSACPAGALTQNGYDIPSCKTYLSGRDGIACMAQGCAVRRSCPVSKGYGRLPEQSAYHMRIFLG